jgi:hypothetical protein
MIPTVLYASMIVRAIKFDNQCISYFSFAADANSVEIAEKHLTKGIEYLETHNLTSGHTGVIFYSPTNDIGLWYENLKSAQSQLQDYIKNDTPSALEESNILMKLDETVATHPNSISFYPHNAFWFWASIFGWSFYLLALLFGCAASDLS